MLDAATRPTLSSSEAEWRLALLQTLRLAGCPGSCIVETWFSIERLAWHVMHKSSDAVDGGMGAFVWLEYLTAREWIGSKEQRRLIELIKSAHAAERAYYKDDDARP